MVTHPLLAELETLTHNDRTDRLVEAGRRAARGDAGARRFIADLRKSADAFERLLALVSVFGSRDGAIVRESLSDPSRMVRRKAGGMLALFCDDRDDAQASRALGEIAEARLLRRTVAQLVRRKRFAIVDAFLSARMAKERESEIVDLLPFGSEELVSKFMPDILEAGGPSCWQRLAVRHPSFAAAWFLEDTKRSKSLDPRQRDRLMQAIGELAERAPDPTLDLIKALFEIGEEPDRFSWTLGRLVRSRPREAFDLLKGRQESARPVHPPGVFGVVRFDKVAHKLGPQRLDYLIRHAWSTLSDAKRGVWWFLRLASDDRKAVLRAFMTGGHGGWGAFLFRYFEADSAEEKTLREQAFERWSHAAQGTDGTISPDVLDWLPRDLREREARRHLEECAALVTKPERRLVYARLLSFGAAKQALAPFLGHPEGEERARAQRTLIASVFHDCAAMADALANIKARKFEQAPVRQAMFEALLGLPVARYLPGHLEAVSGVVQDALDAADLSSATASAVERLVVRLFRIDGPWGAGWVAKLFRVRGSVSTYGLGDGLTKSQAERLSPALEELATKWATRERAGAVISLARSLGIRLGSVTPLLVALERLSRELPFVSVAAMALGLLKKHDRARFNRLVPELLRDDKSFVLIPDVAKYISLRRQDLLNDFIEPGPMQGRFATGRTHWVIGFETGHARWTSRQQQTYAAGLISLLKEEDRDVPTLRFAISTLVRLAFADATQILPFAADPRQPVREMAIRGLPWLDARQGLPVLIEALGDDRARWAIYALRKVFSELRRAQVLAELRSVPMKKVTVAKEVVRLLGELGGRDAYQDLLNLDKPEMHRDVRIALLRALWDHLERPETWQIFEKAVRDPDWIVASKLADIPLGRLSGEAEERVVTLLSTILGRAEAEARLDLLKRAASIPLGDRDRSLMKTLVAHMGTPDPDEAAHAFAAVLHRMTSDEVEIVVKRLHELVPQPRHLVALLPVLSMRLGPHFYQRTWVRVAEDLLGALAANPWTTPHYLSLGSRLWDWQKLSGALIELSRKDLLHYDALQEALSAVKSCVHPELVEAALRDQSDPRLRRLALAALVVAAGPENGWTRERRARLLDYRRDSAPGVAGPANFIFPP